MEREREGWRREGWREREGGRGRIQEGTEYFTTLFTAVSGSKFQTRQAPRLYVRWVSPSKSHKAAQALLPLTIVTSSTYTQLIGSFRRLVGVSCLRGRLGLPLQSESR